MSATDAFRDETESDSPLVSLDCPRCDEALVLHQPDPDLPDRLLATCSVCKSWYLTNSDVSALMALTELTDRDSAP